MLFEVRMNRKTRNVLLALAVWMSAVPLTAQSGQSAQSGQDEGYWAKDLISRFKFNGYAQAGYTYTRQDGKNSNTLDIKRTLLWVKAQVTDRWSFLFMHDFSSVVQEFYTDYRITSDKSLTVRFGQFKNQLSMENPYSPTVCELVDVYSQAVTYLTGCGSDPLYGVQYGRDLGIELYGQLFDDRLYYNVQLLNGSGINRRDEDNKKDIIVKLDYRPLKGLKLVASAQKGYATAVGTSTLCPRIGVGDCYRRDRWTVGAEYKTKGGQTDYWKDRCLSVRGEVLGGRDGDIHSWGAYAVTSVPIVGQLDAIASVDYFCGAKDVEYWTPAGGGTLYEDYEKDQTNLVVGLQYWFFRKCRVQAQYTWSNSWDHGTYSRIQIQTQIAF